MRETPEEKIAPTPVPIEDEIRERWSPRAFADRDVSEDDLRVLFEAARWAPSSFNEQPWRFILARRRNPEAFADLLGCLTEGNQAWADDAPVLMITAAKRSFEGTGKENRHAFHDVGLAVANLTHQATSMGLFVHQMAGIDPERAREVCGIPDGFDAVTAVAIGYLGSPEDLDDPKLRERETDERSRRALSDTVFEKRWGMSAPFTQGDGSDTHGDGPDPSG